MRAGRVPRATTFKSVLCAVDFSPQSDAALQAAGQVARACGGHLTVLNVEDPLLSAGAAAGGYDTAYLKKSTLARLNRLMERMAARSGLGPGAWTTQVLLGKPARAILLLARKISADLIVMGTNGRSGPAKWFFGSVANQVLTRTTVPALVVARNKPRSAAPVMHGRPVVGGIELERHARFDARRIARAAQLLSGDLTLVHVVYRAGDVPTVEYYQAQLAAAQKRLQRLAKSVGAHSRVLLGRPEDGIVAAASEVKAGLIVLALRRGRGIFGARQGATTYRVLCSSNIPVLALPPAWRAS
jgi:nucleotide-binding universal stress UspA family protein